MIWPTYAWLARGCRSRTVQARSRSYAHTPTARIAPANWPSCSPRRATASYAVVPKPATGKQPSNFSGCSPRRATATSYADADDWAAVSHLGEQLAHAGDDLLRRYGFDLYRRIADGPTWYRRAGAPPVTGASSAGADEELAVGERRAGCAGRSRRAPEYPSGP